MSNDELDRAIAAVIDLFEIRTHDKFRQQLLDLINATKAIQVTIEGSQELIANIFAASAAEVADFRPVDAAALKLDEALAALERALLDPNSFVRQRIAVFQASLVSKLLVDGAPWPEVEAELARIDQAVHDPAEWLAEKRRHLAPLLPTTRPRGRPRSTFNLFVRQLRAVTQANGGNWSNTKVKGELEWHGRMLQALEELRPFLPATGFFPKGKLGRALEDLLKNTPP